MRVYYLTSHKIAVEHIFPERRMKLSLFHELNDPFELQPYSLTDKNLRKINRALEKDYFGKKGVMCFSDNWRSPVMWAHYAEKHYGVCLGFDIPDINGEKLVNPMEYNSGRIQFMLDEKKVLHGIDKSFIQRMLYSKGQEWAYEREYRTISDLQIHDPKTGFHYVDFGPQLQLREVILGARNSMPVGQMAKLVRQNDYQVLVFKSRPAFQEFAMVPNKLVKSISVSARRQKVDACS